jgi:PA14 domain
LKGHTSTSVVVDGVPCKVDPSRSTEERIFCETGSKATPSTIGPQPGQPGITYRFVNPTDTSFIPEWTNSIDETFPKVTSLTTTLETPWTLKDEKAMHVFDGWFKAPETGEYRFYMQADDQYKLFLDSTNPYDASSPVTTTLVQIGYQGWFKSWRQYNQNDNPNSSQGNFVTNWITLEAGKYYKLRGQHRDTGGDYWSTVSLEFKKPGSEDHPMAAKAVQSLKIDQT